MTALLTLLAARWGRGWGTPWVTAAVAAGQLSVGWANDYLDRDRDRGRSDKPVAAGEIPAAVVGRAAVVALVAAVLLSLASGLPATAVHIGGLALAHAYNWRLKWTPLSVLAYGLAFALAPAFVTLGLRPARFPAAWVTVAAGLLGAGAHFTQTLGDHDRDRADGIRGLPQRIGRRGSVVAAGLILATAAMVATLGPGRVSAPALALLAVSLLLVAATVAAGLAGRYLLSFRLTIGAAGAAALIFVAGAGSGVVG